MSAAKQEFHDIADLPASSYERHPVEDMELDENALVRVGDVCDLICAAPYIDGEDVRELIDGVVHLPKQHHDDSNAARACRSLLSQIIEAKDPKLEAKCICIAVGLVFIDPGVSDDIADQDTMTKVGASHGVTKADVSKKVTDFQERHGISSIGWNKKQSSRRNYAETNSRRTKI